MAMLFGGHRDMTRETLLARLASLRQARVGQVRVPHKPLLLLWLFGQFAETGSSAATYCGPSAACSAAIPPAVTCA
jgi:putative restriction endonuclease